MKGSPKFDNIAQRMDKSAPPDDGTASWWERYGTPGQEGATEGARRFRDDLARWEREAAQRRHHCDEHQACMAKCIYER